MPSRWPMFAVVLLTASAVIVLSNLQPPSQLGPLEPSLPDSPIPKPAAFTGDFRGPEAHEVEQVLARAFPDAVPFRDVRADAAVVGDFNGDHAPDLAVPVRPAHDRLGWINAEFVNWSLLDPTAPMPDPSKGTRPTVGDQDLLLAVVHGLGPQGWRSPEARQAYLIKVTDSDGRLERLPRKTRDFIYEGRGHRFLYWTGARYAWHVNSGPVR
jgi:hypothetical protein